MNTYREIGVAGCCGAIAGTAVAIVCDWSIWMLVPAAITGALTAFACYNPREVVSTIGAFGRDGWKAATAGGWAQMCCRIDKVVVWQVIRTTVFVLACIFMAVGSFILLPAIFFMAGFCPNASAVLGAAAVLFGLGGAGIFMFDALGELCEGWSMPLTKRACRWWDGTTVGGWLGRGVFTKSEVVCLSLAGPIMTQAGCLLFVILVIDFILTILLVCASTERIAAILGAMLGLCAATVLHFCGVPGSLAGSLVILAASGAVGWFAGPLLHRLRADLAREPAAETVRS